jgi:hypothetical protein
MDVESARIKAMMDKIGLTPVDVEALYQQYMELFPAWAMLSVAESRNTKRAQVSPGPLVPPGFPD